MWLKSWVKFLFTEEAIELPNLAHIPGDEGGCVFAVTSHPPGTYSPSRHPTAEKGRLRRTVQRREVSDVGESGRRVSRNLSSGTERRSRPEVCKISTRTGVTSVEVETVQAPTIVSKTEPTPVLTRTWFRDGCEEGRSRVVLRTSRSLLQGFGKTRRPEGCLVGGGVLPVF